MNKIRVTRRTTLRTIRKSTTPVWNTGTKVTDDKVPFTKLPEAVVLARLKYNRFPMEFWDNQLSLKVSNHQHCNPFRIFHRFLLFLVDGSGAGSGDLEILVEGGRVTSSVRSLGGQRFKAAFTPHQALPHRVDIKFNGETVPGKYLFMLRKLFTTASRKSDTTEVIN